MIILVVLTAALALGAGGVRAAIYKWTAEKGERVYREDKDREQFRQRLQQVIEANCESK